jgi:hypothetical protein
VNISRRQLYAMGEPIGEGATREDVSGRRILGDGGGGGGGQSVTTQEIPGELKPLASAYTAKAMGLSSQPFQAYTGQRFADLNGTQQSGLGMIEQRAQDGSSIVNTAEGNLAQMMGGGPNPYLDAMVSKAQASALGAGQQAGVRSGSFGNSGIAEATAKQVGDIATNMYGQAYESDAARRLQAIGMAPGLNQAGYQDAQQLLQAGQIRQDQEQQGLDFGYQTFQEEQNKPYKDLAAMAGVFNSNLGGTSTTQQSGGGGK